MLKECILNVLELAEDHEDISSVSFPAIASGKRYKFPKDEVAEIMLTAVIEWVQKNALSEIKTIRLCNFDTPTYELFKEEMFYMFNQRNDESDTVETVSSDVEQEKGADGGEMKKTAADITKDKEY